MDRLLTVDEAAEILGTTSRFPRRLIAERRIRFVKAGRHVRIPSSALAAFIAWRAPASVDSHRSGTMVYEERCGNGIDTPEVHRQL